MTTVTRVKTKRTICLLMAVLLSLLIIGCSGGQKQANAVNGKDSEIHHKIGVSVFNPADPELSMFLSYYKNYIAESFPVEFIVSDALNTTEDEIAFIEAAKEQGAEGIISFYGLGLSKLVKACGENEMYYVLGSSSISDEEFDAVKDDPWFLGVIGPEDEEEFEAGREMAENFADAGAMSYMIMSGGAGDAGNFMHYTRVRGMLSALQEKLGLTYEQDIDELAAVTSVTEVVTGRDDVDVVISPGYVQIEEGAANMKKAFETDDYDALLSAVGINSVEEEIALEIASSEREMLVGAVDCFSEENYHAVEKKDANGNPLLNFVKGKYASMVAPAFIAMYNAVEGDLDVIRPEGEAFRLPQSYWTAANEKEYVELYGYTQSIFENAYSSADMMGVIKAYDDGADFEKFRALAEACDIDSVRERLGE